MTGKPNDDQRPAAPATVIPWERLPPGFAARLDTPASPVEARPAATVVLVRDTEAGAEVLLLRRHRASGFVPGAWVFPGGRVDEADAEDANWAGVRPPHAPAPSFWVAAVREAFEETGILLARDEAGAFASAAPGPPLAHARAELLEDRLTLAHILHTHSLRLAVDAIAHIAHWVTPLAEPRRYDTHFFLARVPATHPVAPDPREITDALWLTASGALERFAAGRLPMVFPTVKVLERLAPFDSASAAIDALRNTAVRTILPRLVRMEEGIGFVIDEEGRT